MDNSEKLSLTWNDFEDKQKSSFAQLRTETDLTNVTLAFDDGKQVEAQKVVLAPPQRKFSVAGVPEAFPKGEESICILIQLNETPTSNISIGSFTAPSSLCSQNF